MKKKIVYGVILFAVAIIGFGFLSAANNKVAIVDKHSSEADKNRFGAEKNSPYLTNIINSEKSDLSNGKVVIDITLHNTLNTEIMYAIDNWVSGAATSEEETNAKTDLIEKIKNIANDLAQFNNANHAVKQGISVTTNGSNVLMPLEDKNIESRLESIKNIEPATGNNAEIFTSIQKAADAFSTSSNNKILVVFVKHLSDLTEDQITAYKEIVDNAIRKGIKIIVNDIDASDFCVTPSVGEEAIGSKVPNSAFKRIFESATYDEETCSRREQPELNCGTDDYYRRKPYNSTYSIILSTLPKGIENVATKISFDKVLLDNFDIENITISVTRNQFPVDNCKDQNSSNNTQSNCALDQSLIEASNETANCIKDPSKELEYTFDKTEGAISFNSAVLASNEDLNISYTLKVKDKVDSSILDTTVIRTARQIVLTGDINAQLPLDSKIDDQVCSPTIMVLSEAPENPYTGTYDYIIFGSCMLAVALVTLVIMNSKKSFERI